MGPAKNLKYEDRYDAFDNGKVLANKKKGSLPAMGWNSWNAFGSNNTEALTKLMADKIVELGLDKLGYEYIVLDDGCYKPERVEGRLVNNPEKFASGFKSLADYIHAKGLKFGMYNDIGEKLCSGAAVGTCGYEDVDTQDYVNWDIDFIKVDNCYYLWDNATFSNPENARYVYAPNIKGIRIESLDSAESELELSSYIELSAVNDAKITGPVAKIENDYVTGIGTFDGTGPQYSPIDERSSELHFEIEVEEAGLYRLYVNYATGKEEGVGSWLQLGISNSTTGNLIENDSAELFFDDFLEETELSESFVWSEAIDIRLTAGKNVIRIMNHRRQENTLHSYATFLEGLNAAKADHDIRLSICEWGKTQPQNWGKKIGDSWRILNDITFNVGDDGDNGSCRWKDDYTPSITSQYNKAVIMDEFAGLDKGWNDPDMLVVGMDGVTEVMARTHMALWCMMNSPLMLGMDLRRVQKGDSIYQIIANERLIALNQDSLGIQAKRVYCSLALDTPDTTYVRNLDRVDIIAKPLSDNSFALCFVNVSEQDNNSEYAILLDTILGYIGEKMPDVDSWAKAKGFEVTDIWTGENVTADVLTTDRAFVVNGLKACDHAIYRIKML